MSVISILESLEADNSRLAKEKILQANRNNDVLKRVFIYASDPWMNWGVSKYNKPKSPGQAESTDDKINLFLDLLKSLNSRELTGNKARGAVEGIISSVDKLGQKWFERLLWRNLRCGVSDSTINKVWPGSIIPFAVSLAETLETKGVNGNFEIVDSVKYPVRVEAKLDGLRCVVVKANGEVTIYTRNGTILETLPTIKAATEKLPFDNFVIDGEAMGEDWSESASVLMSAKSKKDDSTMRYHVFDYVSLSDWQAQSTSLSYSERLQNLITIIGADPKAAASPFRYVKHKVCNNETELREFYASCLDEGYEGVMLKDIKAPYKWKRSDAILKLKPVATEEGVIISWRNAPDSSKRAGTFGGFDVLTSNGVVTRVGGGYSDKLKAEINQNPDSWIGKIVECEHQPPLTPDGKMRFPVFSRFREKSDVDPKIYESYLKFIGKE
jgi:DNA ligase-1